MNLSFALQLIFISWGNMKTRQAMENSSANTEYSKSIQFLLCTAHSSGKHWAFFSANNFVLSITAILGNTLILVALHKESSLHSPSKHLYRCLAITDLLVGLILQPSVASYYALLVKEHRPADLCLSFGTISAISFTTLSAVSMLTMTTISVDRLLALLLGLRYRHIVTLKRVRGFVLLFWILSLGFAVVTIWEFQLGKYYNLILISLCILLSTLCYSKIFVTLRQHQVQAPQQQGQPDGGGIPFNIARYRKTVATAIWVEVTLIACYLPYAIVVAVIFNHGSSPFLDVIWESAVTLVCLNSSLDQILYCWKIRAVKQEVKNTIRQILCLSSLLG